MEKHKRYESRRGRFETIDYTSTVYMGEDFKVIGLYGRLLVENLDINLVEFTIAFFVEANEVVEKWRTKSLSLLRTLGWQSGISTDEELVAVKGIFQIRLRWFKCPVCDRQVFACLLCHPISHTAPRIPLQYPWCRRHSEETMREAYRPYEVRTVGKDHLAKETSTEEVAELLSGSRSMALTGAGVSKASGISTFSGPEGIETSLKISEDKFYRCLFEEPAFITKEVAKFQASFMVAEPNPAHLALAELERKGVLTFIITENGDGLHQEAGSRRVLEIWSIEGLRKHFLESRYGWDAIKGASLLLTIGIGSDEHGLIEYARDSSLKILAIGPERPNFLTKGDYYLRGQAEELLPKILVILSNH